MSDLTAHVTADPIGEDITAADPNHTQDVPSPIPDDAIPALASQLREIFAEIAKAAAAEAIAATPVPSFRPGTVQGANLTTGDITVLMDGDTSTVTVQTIAGTPVYNDRVMVCFVPPSTAFIIGFIGRGGVGVPAGTIVPYGGIITSDTSTSSATAPPSGWLWCRGQTVAQASYPALYAAIGTTFNTGGEASTDFRLPDLRGRIPIGLDNMGGSDAGRLDVSNTLGASGGSQYHTLSTSQMPNHAHTFTPSGSVSISSVTGSVSGSISGTTNSVGIYPIIDSFLGYGDAAPNSASGNAIYGPATSYHDHTVSGTFSGSISGGSGTGSFSGFGGTTSYDGSGSGVNHLPPYLLVHYIIKG